MEFIFINKTEIKTLLRWLSGLTVFALWLGACATTPEPTVGNAADEESSSLAAAVTPVAETEEQTADRAVLSQRQVEEAWGIQIRSLRRTAAGHMLDFRFKVLDPDKAAQLLRREDKPYLIHLSSGKKLAVPSMPKIGPLRPTAVKPEPNRVYFILFSNQGELVKKGNTVSIVIGDLRIENLTVE
jgi:hypothetical protein